MKNAKDLESAEMSRITKIKKKREAVDKVLKSEEKKQILDAKKRREATEKTIKSEKNSNCSLITDLGLLRRIKTKTEANYLKGTNLQVR